MSFYKRFNLINTFKLITGLGLAIVFSNSTMASYGVGSKPFHPNVTNNFVNFCDPLDPGAINGSGQVFCHEGDPTILGEEIATSGGDGDYFYKWQHSNNGNDNWIEIAGANGTTYDPPAGLTETRWYRRAVASCNQIEYSTAIEVVVDPALIWYADWDNDGLGDPLNTINFCQQPEGYVENNDDECPFEYGTENGCNYVTLTLSNENYVYARTYHRAMPTPDNIVQESDVQESVVYFDGLGRPMQDVAIKASPIGNDVVTHMEYDNFGRQIKEWLPYGAANGETATLRPEAQADTEAYYLQNHAQDLGNVPNPFSQKELQASPLGKVLKQAAPGEDWQLGNEHEIVFEYGTNAKEEVLLYGVDTNFADNIYEPTLLDANGENYYKTGELHKTTTKDENHVDTNSKLHTTEGFTNKQGQVLLKRTYAMIDDKEIPHDTYYVYDDFGNLTYVIPPKVDTSDGISPEELNQLCYQYKYDHRNRLAEKKIPGKAWEYIVYNALDQPIMTRDALLQGKGLWLFTRYDAFGRVAFTGMVTGLDRLSEQTAADNTETQYTQQTEEPTAVENTSLYYNANGYPLLGSVKELHTIAYYDNYNETRDGIAKPVGQILGQEQAVNVQGLPTADKVRVLDTKDWITTLTVYDKKGRTIWTQTNNPFLKTTDIVSTELGFAGNTLQQQTEHTKDNNPTITATDTFAYDHAGRLAMQQQSLDGHTETLYLNLYDELGQLRAKQVGNTADSPLQTVDHTYNIRGWLTDINNVNNKGSDLFTFKLHYNGPTDPNAEALYNGNIAQANWSTANTNASKLGYTYHYDALNRINNAQFVGGDFTDRYSLEKVAYDKNGNIQEIVRKGHTNSVATTFGIMDYILYTYDSGNKLTKVWDIGSDTQGFADGADIPQEYEYDANGNMIVDANKGLDPITYNHLNLPTRIKKGNQGISYIYDATGVKLKKEVSTGTVTEYAGNYIYENSTLQFFNQPEGYVSPDGNGGYDYIYQYKDHLGNVRLSYTDVDGNLEIVEESNYYPFGLKHKGYNGSTSPLGNDVAQKWSFLGQERQDEFGLNWLTFRYRNYMPEIGRFFGVDPISEEFLSISNYQFAHNNPIWKIEIEGLEGEVSPEIPGSIDVINHESVRGHTNVGSSAIPIGDGTGQHGSASQPIFVEDYQNQGSAMGYPGQALDEAVTAGVQLFASELSGSDVSTDTAGIIEMAANAIILITSKGKNGKAVSELTEQVVKSEAKVTSRAARREVMRKEGIPTSQQPKSQSNNASGREYSYETPKKGGGTETKSVQQQTMDRSHKGQSHWEAGKVKTDNGKVRTNNYGRPKLQNDKKKVDYNN